MSLISIIVPVYNAEKYIKKCIDSILSQSFKHIEIIAINDASSDGSIHVLEGISKIDERLKIIDKKTNQGVHQARKDGIIASKGDFIAFADSDDWYEKNTLQLLYDAIKREDADIALCGVRIVKINGKHLGTKVKLSHQVFEGVESFNSFCELKLGTGSLWNKLYRRHLITKYGTLEWGWAAAAGEDTLVNIGCFLESRKTVTIPEVLYNYAIHPNNATQSSGEALGYARILRAYASAIENYSNVGDAKLEKIDELYRYQLRLPSYHVNSPDELKIHRDLLEQAIAIISSKRPRFLYEMANIGIALPKARILNASAGTKTIWYIRQLARNLIGL